MDEPIVIPGPATMLLSRIGLLGLAEYESRKELFKK
jgi:hypothetical protein